jgi:hypothetical protein
MVDRKKFDEALDAFGAEWAGYANDEEQDRLIAAARDALWALVEPKENDAVEVRCSKCGGRDILTRYVKRGEYPWRYSDDYDERNTTATREMLTRRCRTCQHHWIDEVASTEER